MYPHSSLRMIVIWLHMHNTQYKGPIRANFMPSRPPSYCMIVVQDSKKVQSYLIVLHICGFRLDEIKAKKMLCKLTQIWHHKLTAVRTNPEKNLAKLWTKSKWLAVLTFPFKPCMEACSAVILWVTHHSQVKKNPLGLSQFYFVHSPLHIFITQFLWRDLTFRRNGF